MENSFFEYRDATGVEEDSDTEIIDNSIVEDQSLSSKNKPGFKNHTVFVAESEESPSEDDYDEGAHQRYLQKSVIRKSSAVAPTVISSSDEDSSKRGSIRRQSDTSNKVVLSSSDEEMSPEIVPRQCPITKTPRSSESFIGKKTRKRMMILDSDTENSIIIEHNKNSKHACLKDTPAKMKDLTMRKSLKDIEKANDSCSETEPSGSDNVSDDDVSDNDDTSLSSNNGNDKSNIEQVVVNREKTDVSKDLIKHSERSESLDSENNKVGNESGRISNETCEESQSDSAENSEEDDDRFDEDKMVMSRATRMSIMGYVPKETPSDDSDFIQSDDNSSTRPNSANSLADLPDVSVSLRNTARESNVEDNTSTRPNSANSLPDPPDVSVSANEDNEANGDYVNDASRITCSPFTSPPKDIADNVSLKIDSKNDSDKVDSDIEICDLTQNVSLSDYDTKESKRSGLRNRVLNEVTKDTRTYKENVIDDDVTIIDSNPEIIALSSDDDDDIKEEKKSPQVKKSSVNKEETSTKTQKVDSNIKQYLLPPSHPNRVVYVKKQVRENELSKLQGLQEDLHNIRHLLENMDVDTLPDKGVKLIERLSALEQEVRRQGDKVASMVVEPDNPTAEDIAKDGFKNEVEKVVSWDDIQKASNAVQPKMFGKQAMSTHVAERSLMLQRLRDLHESLGSRPADGARAPAPAAVRSALLPHQLHALAWLRWRETQRPCGGVLADDMGLGKTITMISLIASDKDGNMDDDEEEDDERTGKNNSRLVRGGSVVVCPASLVQQWAGEVARHCRPHALSVCLHHGAARAAQPHRLAAFDLVLTTYNILLRETEKGGALCRVRWRRAILDEAHVVRNHKSATAAAVLPAALRARRRWALTGTPLHNRDLDLFALLRFLGCSPFDELAVWKKWIDNKSLGGQERLSTIMRCVMLRRTKAQLQQRGQLACLPPRALHERPVALARDEMNVYQKLLVFSKTLFAQFLHQRAEKRADAQGFLAPSKDSAYAEMHKKMIKLQGAKPVKSHEILVLLLRLRQVCCHCGLIAAMLTDHEAGDEQLDADTAENDLLEELNKLVLEDKKKSPRRKSGENKGEAEEDGAAEEGTTAAEAIRSVLSRNNPVFNLERRSSKIKAVMDCLNENVFPNDGEKAVVVSQWTGVLRLVERELRRAGVQCVSLSGHVPVPARTPLVERLNDPQSPVRVMLLSLTAGGVGLNLCGASHLLLLDPHWNPQLEQQAQDRVYRVGQQRPVNIYRFMCVDTVEQSIRRLQQVKLELADSVLTGARHNNASKLSIEDLKMLFNMGQ